MPPPPGRALGGCELGCAAHPALGAGTPPHLPVLQQPCKLQGDCRITLPTLWGSVHNVFDLPVPFAIFSRKENTQPQACKHPCPQLSAAAPQFPPAAGKGLCNCHQYNCYVLGLHPLPAAQQVDFGLCLHFIPLSLQEKALAGGSQGALPGSGTLCSTPKRGAGTSHAVGKAGRDVVGRQHPDPPQCPHPGDAREGAWGVWGHGGPLCTLWPGQYEVLAPGGSPTP